MIEAEERLSFETVSVAIKAIYEDGRLRPLEPLNLAENTLVRLSLDALPEDADRLQWLAQAQLTLMKTWDNEADDVYNELLSQ